MHRIRPLKGAVYRNEWKAQWQKKEVASMPLIRFCPAPLSGPWQQQLFSKAKGRSRMLALLATKPAEHLVLFQNPAARQPAARQ
jgi:hypothetical protein